jgi:hypothetical protein
LKVILVFSDLDASFCLRNLDRKAASENEPSIIVVVFLNFCLSSIRTRQNDRGLHADQEASLAKAKPRQAIFSFVLALGSCHEYMQNGFEKRITRMI